MHSPRAGFDCLGRSPLQAGFATASGAGQALLSSLCKDVLYGGLHAMRVCVATLFGMFSVP